MRSLPRRAYVERVEASASNVAGEQVKDKLHVVVAGHIDAGKSTLMGRLLHDLGHVSKQEVHRNQKLAT